MQIEAKEEVWPLKEVFRISRGSRTEAQVVVVTVNDGKNTGRGEGVPIARYNQTIDSVLAQIESIKSVRDLDRDKLQHLLPPVRHATRWTARYGTWKRSALANASGNWRTFRLFLKSRPRSRSVSIRQTKWRQQRKPLLTLRC